MYFDKRTVATPTLPSVDNELVIDVELGSVVGLEVQCEGFS